MTRRRKIQIASVVAAAFVAAGGMAANGYNLAAQYRTDLEYGYRRAFSDLGDYVSGMETALIKASYANTPTQQNAIASLLMKEASGAKSSLAALPTTSGSMETVQKFVAQVEDFSAAVASKVSRGEALSDDDRQTLSSLEQYASLLHDNLMEVQKEFDASSLHLGETKQILGNLDLDASLPAISQSLETAAADFKDYPTLIYDGPFSDHISQLKPKWLENRSTVSLENARRTAAAFFGLQETDLAYSSSTQGNLPTYNFTGGSCRISVTQQGGLVCSLIDSRTPAEAVLTFEEASAKAQEFLAQNGMDSLTETYYVINDNLCTIQYAYAENDITFYPDLIKVTVALDDGSIVEYDGSGYLMNHHDRAAQTPSLTKEDAQSRLSPELSVEAGRLAVIPTPGLDELLCYEFLCKGDGEDQVLVYVNAATGMEEQIFLRLQGDGGVLVI